MPKAKPDHGSARAPRRARLMARDQAEAFLRALAQGNPAPETELFYTDHFSLLVAVVLSAQTTDAAVNKCTPALFAAAPTPAAMAAGVGAALNSPGVHLFTAASVVCAESTTATSSEK